MINRLIRIHQLANIKKLSNSDLTLPYLIYKAKLRIVYPF